MSPPAKTTACGWICRKEWNTGNRRLPRRVFCVRQVRSHLTILLRIALWRWWSRRTSDWQLKFQSVCGLHPPMCL